MATRHETNGQDDMNESLMLLKKGVDAITFTTHSCSVSIAQPDDDKQPTKLQHSIFIS